MQQVKISPKNNVLSSKTSEKLLTSISMSSSTLANPELKRKQISKRSLAISSSKFEGLFTSCEMLQKDLNTISSKLSKEKIDQSFETNFEGFSTKRIRDEDYLTGIKRIQERIKKRQDGVIPDKIKNLIKLVNKKYMKKKTIVQHADLVCESAVRFLNENKRKFGTSDRSKSEVVAKLTKRSKNKDIKINPDETIFEGYLAEAEVLKFRHLKRNSSLVNAISPPIQSSIQKLPKLKETQGHQPKQSEHDHVLNRLNFRKYNSKFSFN